MNKSSCFFYFNWFHFKWIQCTELPILTLAWIQNCCFLNLTSPDKFISTWCHFTGLPGGGDSTLFHWCSSMPHFNCNSFSRLLTCQSHWNNDWSRSNSSVQYLPGHQRRALLEPLLVWERPLFLQHVCLCFIMSAGISEQTVSIWDWSTTAENRGIRHESCETCQSEYGLYMCYRQTEVFQCAMLGFH